MKAIITVQLDNAAFHGHSDDENSADGTELAAVLKRFYIQETAVEVGDTFTAQDSNGNTVARMEITAD